MKRGGSRRVLVGAAIVLAAIVALGAWQWQPLMRTVISSVAASTLGLRVSFARMSLGFGGASFDDVEVTSGKNEPVARIAHVSLGYDLRDLLPGGTRLFGLESVVVESPRVFVVRHADGTYNLPLPHLPANRGGKQKPLIVRARIRNGSIEVLNESRNALPGQRRLYAENVQVDADISSSTRSSYTVSLDYGERAGELYPVRGRGRIDPAAGFIDNHWTAAALPVGAAVNFVVDSAQLRVDSGALRNVDARYFALAGSNGNLQPHLAGSAVLGDGRISIAGLAEPVTAVRGRFDVYDNGLVTPELTASLAGVPASASGGIYDLNDPRVRIAIRGSGDVARLRTAFTQARNLPMRGPLAFGLLVEGRPARPLIWIDLRSRGIAYASTPIDDLGGFVAFDGREADVGEFAGSYRGNALSACGRVALQRGRNAVEMLLETHSPAGAVPYAGAYLPQMPLDGIALATAADPKTIGLRGLLSGSGPAQRLDAVFDVDSRGVGSIGPLRMRATNGSLYARVAIDRPHGLVSGVAVLHDYSVPGGKLKVNASLFGAQSKGTIGVTGLADVATPLGGVIAQARVASNGGALRGGISGRAAGQASFGASLAGTLQAPRLVGTVVVADGRYRNFDVNGAAGLAFADGTLQIRDAAVAAGPLFVAAAGSITGVLARGGFAPSYDLATELHSSDVSGLLAVAQPRAAGLVQGSVDARLRVRGTGTRPSFAGTMSAPEGSVNGLAFRDLRGAVTGNAESLALARGRVVVGSTDVALSGGASTRGANADVRAPQADLADFNDFFDEGDLLAGTGFVALRATTRGMHLAGSNGEVSLRNARFRRLALGSVEARWHDAGRAIAATLSLGGPTGRIRATGSFAPAEKRVDGHAAARSVDLGTWLPMLGFSAPVTGRLDADTTVSGSYPDLSLNLHAALSGATAGRLPVERFEVTASAAHGRGTIQSAVLEVPSLSATASGRFGLRESDALALVAHVTSPNVGAFLNRASGKDFGIAGTLDSTLQINGTRARPQLRDTMTLSALSRGNLTIPRVSGEIDADERYVRLRNAEIDLARGRALLSAELPILFERSAIAIGTGPVSGSLAAQDVELSNFAPVLPKGTQIDGRIDGNVTAGGTVNAPQLSGALALRNGAFSGPMVKSPIGDIGAELAFSGTHAALQSTATAGGGKLSARGDATLASLRDPAGLAYNVQASADNARLDLPAYFAGVLNGSVALAARAADPQLSGDVSISNARIPVDAFLNRSGGANQSSLLSNLAFSNLRIAAGNDVRVQSKNADIGATGDVTVGGTLDAPSLSGSFRSTGGSLSFYRTFTLQSGTVSFAPSSGVIPDVDAVATTFVANPPTAIRLHVTGRATSMNLGLESDPSYSREQILGLLVGAQQFGAVRGVASTGNGGFSATSIAQQYALGQVNTLFVRNLLQPLSASVAGALGFTEVQFTADIQTGLGVNAVKAFGKNVNAIFAQSFGYPRTTSFTLEVNPTVATGLRFNWYTTSGPTLFVLQQSQPAAVDVLSVNRMTQLPPPTGTNGVSFSYLRRFP